MTINFKPSLKQKEVYDIFDDANTTEIVYGGSVGSGKSYLLASLLVMKCLQHDGIRLGLARNSLTNLKKTTLVSIFECIADWGLTEKHYNYNGQSGIITFFNKSEIVLIELTYLPSDPLYTRLGGLLLTFGVIDEAGEVDEKGKEIFQSRLGRWKNVLFGIKPILLMTCNPSRNFLYRDYYIPWKEDRLRDYQVFIQALPSDNPHLPQFYIENLERTLSITERKRLLLGMWEWGDDDSSLFLHDDIMLIYDNSIELSKDNTMRLSCDIAFTSDKCVFIVWQGQSVTNIITFNKATDSTVVEKIKSICIEYGIKTNNVSYDADGVGKFIGQYLPSAREIHNGGKTVRNHGYRNLKTELFFKLSEMVSGGGIKVTTKTYQKEIEEELSCIKHKPKDNIGKIELISKGEMKRVLGRSPDIADALAYGMIFFLKPNSLYASDIMMIDI